MRVKFLPVLLLASCFSLPLFAQHINESQLDTLFERLASGKKMMGSVMIRKGGRVLYQRGFGYAQIEPGNRISNTAYTVYRIGSISKMFTATIVFQLVEEGKLHLSERLAKWFPQIPNAQIITVDQMLNHHSGIHNLTEDTTFMAWQEADLTKEQVLARLAGQHSDFAPGSKASYSNTNFILLGYIAEAVTGKSYPELLRDRITVPLKLTHTSFGRRAIHPEQGEALPYVVENKEWVADPPSNTNVAGAAGGVVSSVGDLATFIEALMVHHFLSDSSLMKMKEQKDGYGRGLLRFPFYEWVGIGHNGRIDNFSSSLAFFPKDSSIVCVVNNAIDYNFNNVLIDVLSSYFGKPFSMPDFSRGDTRISLSEAELKRFEGTYTSDQIHMDITVRAAADGLWARATGQSEILLMPVSEDEFENEEIGARLVFRKSGSAAPSQFILEQGSGHVPFVRKP